MAVEDWFKEWWDADFSWEGLANKPWQGGPDGATLRDYWKDKISEADLIRFPIDSSGKGGRLWTKFHLPLHDLAGKESPKAKWDKETVDRFNGELAQLACIKEGDMHQYPAPLAAGLDGIVTAGRLTIDGSINATFVHAIFSGDIWFRQAQFHYFRRSLPGPRSLNLFSRAVFAGYFDAWFVTAGYLNCAGARFLKFASFYRSRIGHVNFEGASFGGFSSNSEYESANFRGAIFEG